MGWSLNVYFRRMVYQHIQNKCDIEEDGEQNPIPMSEEPLELKVVLAVALGLRLVAKPPLHLQKDESTPRVSWTTMGSGV
eukprot:5977634-Amphidinium_carterae.1